MKNSRLMGVITLALLLSVALLPTAVEAKQKHSLAKVVKKVKSVKTKLQTKHSSIPTSKMTGIASFYGYESGPTTASGEHFNPKKLTAAHRTLPFGTKIRVTNMTNNKSVVVVVNDRGPFIRNRILDLSKAAAKFIGLNGVGKVSITIV